MGLVEVDINFEGATGDGQLRSLPAENAERPMRQSPSRNLNSPQSSKCQSRLRPSFPLVGLHPKNLYCSFSTSPANGTKSTINYNVRRGRNSLQNYPLPRQRQQGPHILILSLFIRDSSDLGQPPRYGLDNWEHMMMQRDKRLTGSIRGQSVRSIHATTLD